MTEHTPMLLPWPRPLTPVFDAAAGRIVAFLAAQDPGGATAAEITKGTGLPLGTVQNVLRGASRYGPGPFAVASLRHTGYRWRLSAAQVRALGAARSEAA